MEGDVHDRWKKEIANNMEHKKSTDTTLEVQDGLISFDVLAQHIEKNIPKIIEKKIEENKNG